MNTFNWTKAAVYGVLTWIAAAVALLILAQFESLSPLWAHSIAAVVAAVSALLFASSERPESMMHALGYAIFFTGVLMLLDLAITQWYDEHIFGSWQYWASYVLVFLAPWVQLDTRTETHAHL